MREPEGAARLTNARFTPATHRQLLEKLDIDPDDPASGNMLYNLPAFPLAHILKRLGPPQRTDISAGNRIILTYPIDGGGSVLIAGTQVDDALTHGMIFIHHPPPARRS